MKLKKNILLLLLIIFFNIDNSLGEDAIKVGVIAPLSGPAAELGIQIKNGIELSKPDLKSNLKFIFEDSQCFAKDAVSAAKKLSSIDKVSVIIGPLCSPPFLSVAKILNDAQITFIHSSSGTQSTNLEKGNYGIEGTATVMEENLYLAKYVKSLGHNTAAIIHFEQEWATAHAKAFADSFIGAGGKIIAKEVFTNPGETDFRSSILKIKTSKPEAIFISAYNGITGSIVKQLRNSGIKTDIFSQYDIEDLTFLKSAGEAANGIRYTYPFDNTNLSAKALNFQKLYLEKYKLKPSFYPYNGYDIALLVDKSIQKCGANSKCIYSQIINTKNVNSLTGLLSFNKHGTISRKFIIKEIRNMNFYKVEQYSEGN